MKRAQIAMEYMFVLGFAVLIAAGYLVIASHAQNQRFNDQAQESVELLAQQLQSELIIAAQVHSGYSRVIDLPSKVRGNSYSIVSSGSLLSVQAPPFSSTRKVPAFVGNFTPGQNTISQVDGVVIVS